MNLLNRKVRHIKYGLGTVIAQDDKYITIEFVSKTSKFAYQDPNLFLRFLHAEEPEVQMAILQELTDKITRDEAAKHADAEVRHHRAVGEQNFVEVAEKNRESFNKKSSVKQQERIPGKRMTFYVFQGDTFDRESRGGYIWAPITNKNGNKFHHWERLLDVHPGDIILHGCDGFVQAVSTARAECYPCRQPEELRSENLWDQEGRRIDCDYVVIKKPIKTSLFVDDILRLCNKKYAPFDKYGNGNLGYLYEIDRELARIFLRATVKYNDDMKNVAYIRELLDEEKNK